MDGYPKDLCDPLAVRADLLARQGAVIAFHMKAWKHPFLRQFFPQKRFHFVPFQITEVAFRRKILPFLEARDKPVVFVWSNNLPSFVAQEIERLGLQVYFMEDGFIRSLEAHAGYSVPFSLSLDSRRPYFDSRGPSDLEQLLLNYDFDNHPTLIQRARNGIRRILQQRLTKYNGRLVSPDAQRDNQQSLSQRVLVIGQVEEDASIRYGCDSPFSNNDLVRLAARENPEAEIVYKPHPDVLSKMRRQVSNPDDVAHLCTVMQGQVSLPDALDSADHVYTITSLAGFEALMRGKKVTTVGAPFYAGWGLTDDRQPLTRRGRELSVEALFAAAYILYPLYFNPGTGDTSTFEETIDSLADPQARARVSLAGRVKWQPYGTYGLLGWRHLLTPIVARVVAKVGNERDVVQYRSNPAGFFSELSDARFRMIGRIIYPWNNTWP
ncbi:capsular polysaccharide biosynthesis protein [Agrobacterium tumefaciens]|jgi:capsule polysaccharide export protein KpsC/LpsZ|uniref:capsular polysaccharide export protein, LipB/KpsS family n=1 Tax=Agrobacterium tumefaciens TaxID=358 RepID=UPI00122FE205|nr:capsular polysaccharide biosynthesis protein [Agrobacterium tumefaciens]NTA61570.1 capsular polysaccharide biosynthesis protein [Agrobacterium tumefaciens]